MKILIVEDHVSIANNIAKYLQTEHFQTDVVHDGEEAFKMALEKHYDLILLDRMLPHLDGLSIARMLKQRENHTPIIFLTAKDKTTDKIEGLEIGADDYIVKPIDLEELTLRIKNIITRNKNRNCPDSTLTVGKVTINFTKEKAFINDVEIPLSPKEFQILHYIAKHKGRVISKEELYTHIWSEYGQSFDSFNNTITVHMSYLRKKLGADIIETIKGSWYSIKK